MTRRSVMAAVGLAAASALAGVSRAAAQDEALIEELAPVLAAEDARNWDGDLFRRSLVSPDSQVRATAALAAGRIGDPRATPLLLQLFGQPDTTVSVAAAFALGLVADTAAAGPIIDRLTGLPALDQYTASEAVTALAKIGGPAVADFFGGVLQGKLALTPTDSGASARAAVTLESWRLGKAAPVAALRPLAGDSSYETRWRAVYALSRLRAPAAANELILALRDEQPFVRASAARALTRTYADSARLSRSTAARLLVPVIEDADAGVRINALRSLATYGDSGLTPRVLGRLGDPDLNVRVEAAAAAGSLGGSAAARALDQAFRSKAVFAVRREALIGLARTDRAAFARAAAGWRASADWRERAAAAEGWARTHSAGPPPFAADHDGRVITVGLQAWAAEAEGPDAALVRTARALLGHPDAGVRSVAADAVARAADPTDLTALTRAFARSGRDSFPDAALSTLNAILAIRGGGTAAAARVDREFLAGTTRPADYLLRRWAEDNWPEAAERWGAAYPVATGRSVQDYRDLARRYLAAPDSLARPHVVIETESRGSIEIELMGPEAPLTVDNFLRLVDQGFFDGNRWHRVVPNFVVQDGDPRGDGFGGPGGTIRDEINRVRYDKPVLGMALSGPDTGSSQWFINLSPQPHLDGTYTVFGKVVGSLAALDRISQGDVIRTIRR